MDDNKTEKRPVGLTEEKNFPKMTMWGALAPFFHGHQPGLPLQEGFFYGGNMTRLPDRNLLEGTKQPDTTTGEFRLAMGNLQQFIADLLGTDSAEKQTARNIFGVQEKYRAEVIEIT